MALAVERHWPAGSPPEGIALTRYGHGLPSARVRVIEAGHPVPDEAGEAAAREILEQVRALGPDDLLLALISGGGSALLSLPAPGISMAQLKRLTSDLLRCGASIQESNTVRKHPSAIQGGRLAAASRAPVLALIVSDVTGDDPTQIASGPCAPDPTSCAEAEAVLEKFGTDASGRFSETPKPGDPAFARVQNRVIAAAHRSLEAAAGVFRQAQIEPLILGDSITGGRRVREVWAIAADTDGIDGTEDNAGAILTPDTLGRARGRGIDARKLLAANDSYGFFSALGDLLVTGPTRTNVNDYRAILIA